MNLLLVGFLDSLFTIKSKEIFFHKQVSFHVMVGTFNFISYLDLFILFNVYEYLHACMYVCMFST